MRFLSLLLLVVGACAPSSSDYEKAIARLRDIDSERPYVAGDHVYYTRVDDDGVRLHCRRSVTAGSSEEILFRDDELTSRWLGSMQVSPDSRWLAVSTETARDRWSLILKDLETGELTEVSDNSDFSLAWDKSGTLYYAQLDETNTPRTVVAVTPKKKPRVVHREKEREVMVAPVDDDAALFIKAPTGILGFRLAPGLDEIPVGPTFTEPTHGGVTTPSVRERATLR
jgi:protease II